MRWRDSRHTGTPAIAAIRIWGCQAKPRAPKPWWPDRLRIPTEREKRVSASGGFRLGKSKWDFGYPYWKSNIATAWPGDRRRPACSARGLGIRGNGNLGLERCQAGQFRPGRPRRRQLGGTLEKVQGQMGMAVLFGELRRP